MTWNKTAFFVQGDIIGTEQRALWLAGATEFSSWSGRPHMGLDCWSVWFCDELGAEIFPFAHCFVAKTTF
jgi:hypothetical protein